MFGVKPIVCVEEPLHQQRLYLSLQGPCGCTLLGYLQTPPRLHLFQQSTHFVRLKAQLILEKMHSKLFFFLCIEQKKKASTHS